MRKLKGSKRTTFVVGRYAFKIPTFDSWEGFVRGLLANMSEVRWSSLKHPLLAPILFHLPGGFLVVMPAAKPMKGAIKTWRTAAYDDPHTNMLFNLVEDKEDSVGLVNGVVLAIDYDRW